MRARHKMRAMLYHRAQRYDGQCILERQPNIDAPVCQTLDVCNVGSHATKNIFLVSPEPPSLLTLCDAITISLVQILHQ